jgi:predicted tellurium resistance membrane protein TerC
MVGTLLVAEACDVHMPKGYLYFAMAFSLAVEAINIRIRTSRGKKANPVELHKGSPD